jgi:hypothetical protein
MMPGALNGAHSNDSRQVLWKEANAHGQIATSTGPQTFVPRVSVILTCISFGLCAAESVGLFLPPNWS